ncbi:MAG: lipopolysaccharide biosynthesis protein [Crocinitomicaceae bacterium]
MSLRSKTIKAFSWDFLGRIVTQVSSFIVSIFLARLLSPEEFGLVAMALAFISISSVFIDIGFSAALIQKQDATDKTYSSIFYFNVAAGLILTVIVYAFAELIGQFYNRIEVVSLLKWLSLIFVFNSFNRVQNVILNKEMNFKQLTIRTFFASVLSGILGIIMAYKGFGVYSLVGQSLSLAFFSTIFLWTTTSWRPSLYFSFNELRGLMKFSVFAFFERIINSIFLKLDVLLLAKLFNPAIIGFYTRSSTLKEQVTKYSSSSIIRVFFPMFSKIQHDKKKFNTIYLKIFSFISFISFWLTAVLFFISEDLILFLFGKKWLPAVPMFQILVFASCVLPLNSLMWNAMMGIGKAKENFYLGLIKKIILLIPFGMAVWQNNITLFILLWVICNYITALINMIYLHLKMHISFMKQLREILTGIMIITPFVFYFIRMDFQLPIFKIVYISIFSILYFLSNWLLKNPSVDLIISLMGDFQRSFKRILKKTNESTN